jgi:carbonic anhydrase
MESVKIPARRHFLKLAAAGGVTLMTVMANGLKPSWAGGHAEALLLSCMDYRLIDDIERYMSGRGLRDNYDHVVLAGAALGAITSSKASWGETFWDHLGVASSLHAIKKVILMDHRDCGAYKVILGEDFGKDPARETVVHSEQLRKLATMIKAKHPKLETETLLMSLDGRVEVIV